MSKKALIVYGGWDGHKPKETAAIIAGDLKTSGVEVDLSETLDSFLDKEKLKTYDLIMPHWTMGEITNEQELGLLHAIESGIGLGGFHGGLGDAFRKHTTFQFMVGGQFVAHPDNHKDYSVQIAKKDDPIVAGLKDFTVFSEQYYLHVDPSNEVLVTTTFQTTSAPWVNGVVMPVAWKRMYGKGRVFYSSIGHDTKEFAVPEVREIMRRGLLWAAGVSL
jgi:type 1 glutamine amidotransferase